MSKNIARLKTVDDDSCAVDIIANDGYIVRLRVPGMESGDTLSKLINSVVLDATVGEYIP